MVPESSCTIILRTRQTTHRDWKLECGGAADRQLQLLAWSTCDSEGGIRRSSAEHVVSVLARQAERTAVVHLLGCALGVDFDNLDHYSCGSAVCWRWFASVHRIEVVRFECTEAETRHLKQPSAGMKIPRKTIDKVLYIRFIQAPLHWLELGRMSCSIWWWRKNESTNQSTG